MMKLFAALFFAFCLSAGAGAQNRAKMDQVLHKYFVSLPFGKKMGDWLGEYERLPDLRLDSSRRELHRANDILFYGVLPKTPVFPNVDSLRIMVGQRTQTERTTINGAVTQEWQDTSFYLDHVYYFPRNAMTGKEWRSFRKLVVKELHKAFHVIYPQSTGRSGSATLAWLCTNANMPPNILATFESDDVEARRLRYLRFTLRFYP